MQKCALKGKNTQQVMCEECLVHHEAKGEYRQREDEDRGHCSDEWRLAFETTLAAALAPPCCTGSECACELTSAFLCMILVPLSALVVLRQVVPPPVSLLSFLPLPAWSGHDNRVKQRVME
jgi:hypothetical protein